MSDSETPSARPGPAGIPRSALVGGGVLALLLVALLVGVQLGDAQVAVEARDPVEAFASEAQQVEGLVRAMTPDLLGVGRMGSTEELSAARERLDDLRARSERAGIPLDLTDAHAAIVRASFERALRRPDLAEAQRVAARFSGRPVGLILEARLALARGERPLHEPLRVLARANDPEVAEAARVLVSHLCAEEDPDEALEMLKERVRPAAAAAARARAMLFKAVRTLDAEALARVLPRMDSPQTRRAAALRISEIGARVAVASPPDPARLERVLRCLLLLGGAPIREEEVARRFAREIATRASEALSRAAGPQDDEAAVLLLERLAVSGLRCGALPALDRALDAVAQRPVGGDVDATRRARLLAALVRLDVRLDRMHLLGLPATALDRLPKNAWTAYLGPRLALANGEEGEETRRALRELASGVLGKELGPIHRARALLEGGHGLPLEEEAPLTRRALALDAGSPWIRVAHAQLLAREGDPARALDEAEGAHVLFDKVSKGRLGEEQGRLRFFRRLTRVHAYRHDEALAEVYLGKLEKAADPEHAALVERTRAILRGD